MKILFFLLFSFSSFANEWCNNLGITHCRVENTSMSIYERLYERPDDLIPSRFQASQSWGGGPSFERGILRSIIIVGEQSPLYRELSRTDHLLTVDCLGRHLFIKSTLSLSRMRSIIYQTLLSLYRWENQTNTRRFENYFLQQRHQLQNLALQSRYFNYFGLYARLEQENYASFESVSMHVDETVRISLDENISYNFFHQCRTGQLFLHLENSNQTPFVFRSGRGDSDLRQASHTGNSLELRRAAQELSRLNQEHGELEDPDDLIRLLNSSAADEYFNHFQAYMRSCIATSACACQSEVRHLGDVLIDDGIDGSGELFTSQRTDVYYLYSHIIYESCQ